MGLQKWKVRKTELVFNHKWYRLRRDEVELSNGKIVDDYFVSVRPDVVVIFAITEDNQVVLVRQYKHGTGAVVEELPGGVIDEGENTEEAARRELLEETGYSSDNFVLINTLIDNPTKDTNKINLFLATNAKKTASQHLDENEEIEVFNLGLNDLKEKIIKGEINVSGSVAGIFLALNYIKQGDA